MASDAVDVHVKLTIAVGHKEISYTGQAKSEDFSEALEGALGKMADGLETYLDDPDEHKRVLKALGVSE